MREERKERVHPLLGLLTVCTKVNPWQIFFVLANVDFQFLGKARKPRLSLEQGDLPLDLIFFLPAPAWLYLSCCTRPHLFHKQVWFLNHLSDSGHFVQLCFGLRSLGNGLYFEFAEQCHYSAYSLHLLFLSKFSNLESTQNHVYLLGISSLNTMPSTKESTENSKSAFKCMTMPTSLMWQYQTAWDKSRHSLKL